MGPNNGKMIYDIQRRSTAISGINAMINKTEDYFKICVFFHFGVIKQANLFSYIFPHHCLNGTNRIEAIS